MYISSIAVSGFRSFRTDLYLDGLSENVNTFVGRNGAGKSNLLMAVRFAICETTKAEEATVISQDVSMDPKDQDFRPASVQLTFTNVPSQTGSSTLTISRVLGVDGRSKFRFNEKTVTEQAYFESLERSGISRAKPFYVVAQGRVTELTRQSDQERLDLLLKVSGADVYETKRENSLKLLSSSRAKLEKVDTVIKSYEEYIEDLRQQKDALMEYSLVDQERRGLEYNILQSEIKRVDELLKAASDDRIKKLKEREELLIKLNTIDEKSASITHQIYSAEQEEVSLKAELKEKKQTFERLQEELMFSDLLNSRPTSADSVIESRHEVTEQELQRLRDKIEELETKIERTTADRETAVAKQNELQRSIEDMNARIYDIEIRKGRLSRFKSQAARDKWIQSEVEVLLRQKNEILSTHNSRQARIDQLQLRRDELSSQQRTVLDKYSSELNVASSRQQACASELEEMRGRRARAQLSIKKGFITALALQEEKTALINSSAAGGMAERLAGNDAARKAARDLGLQASVYGTVAELIDVSPAFLDVAERMAGSALFHLVVDNPETARILADELVRTKAGRATFVPLSALSSTRPVYPQQDDVVPLVEQVACEERFLPVINLVFGGIIVCDTLDTALAVSTEHNFLCTTMEGNSISPSGIMKYGGTSRSSGMTRSLILICNEIGGIENRIVECEERSDREKQELETLQLELTRKTNDLGRLNAELEAARKKHADSERSFASQSRELDEIKAEIKSLLDDAATDDVTTLRLQDRLKEFENDLTSEFVNSLSDEENTLRGTLAEQLRAKQAELKSIQGKPSELLATIQELQTQLRESIKASEYISSRISNESTQQGSNSQVRREDAISTRNGLESAISELSDKLQIIKRELKQGRKELDLQQMERTKINTLLEKSEHSLEKLSRRGEALTQYKKKSGQDCAMLMRTGHDQAVFERLSSLDKEECQAALRKAQERLAEFVGVNKKAADQLDSTSEELRQYNQEYTNLMRDAQTIENVISTLDNKKQEAIEYTIAQIAKSFENSFKMLVPDGTAEMYLETSTGESLLDGQDGETTGVGISVSFDDKPSSNVKLLSGGQKAICALALIFAIQSFDSAPFYIFDEVDAALDPQYRQRVANMVSSLSHANGGQFLCTTFRPELVKVASKTFGVTFSSNETIVAEVEGELALSFVDAQEETSGSP